MAELQRSETSFRRQGSSGLVWNDKFLSAFKNPNQPNANHREPERPLDRSRSDGARPYQAVTVALPPKDPPSPEVATCGLCGFFGKQAGVNHHTNSKSKKRR